MEKELGKVVHYFGHVNVAVIKLTGGDLKIGDTIKLISHGNELFTEKVESMQIEHKDIKEAKNGEEVAVKILGKAKEGTVVYKVEE